MIKQFASLREFWSQFLYRATSLDEHADDAYLCVLDDLMSLVAVN